MIKVGNKEFSDFTIDEFYHNLRSGMELSVSDPISFDIESIKSPIYSRLKVALESKGLQILEVRTHEPVALPNVTETEYPSRRTLRQRGETGPTPVYQAPQDAPTFKTSAPEPVYQAPAEPAYEESSIIPEPVVDDYKSDDISQILDVVNGNTTSSFGPAADADSDLAEVWLFGSSKGGAGKTFTCSASARRYAQLHPDKRVALIDLDITDAQVGIALHFIKPNIEEAFLSWAANSGEKLDVSVAVKRLPSFGPNLDIFAGSNSGLAADRFPNKFWIDFLTKVVEDYDTVFIDTGIDYLNLEPIQMAYQIADRVILLSNTSLKSVTSVKKQIKYLSGAVNKSPYTADMDILGKIGLVFTQWDPGNPLEQSPDIVNNMTTVGDIKIPVLVKFGYIKAIQNIEFLGKWELADDKKFQLGLDRIVGK